METLRGEVLDGIRNKQLQKCDTLLLICASFKAILNLPYNISVTLLAILLMLFAYLELKHFYKPSRSIEIVKLRAFSHWK